VAGVLATGTMAAHDHKPDASADTPQINKGRGWLQLWEPSGEPSSADVRPREAMCSVRFLVVNRYLATVSHIGRHQGSRSHRGSQGKGLRP